MPPEQALPLSIQSLENFFMLARFSGKNTVFNNVPLLVS
jgi:hypothetical protein